MTRVSVIIFMLAINTLMLPWSAWAACSDLRTYLGSSMESMMVNAKIDPIFAEAKNGGEVPIKAKNLCDSFSDEDRGSLMFLENKLVQIKIEKTGKSSALFDFAESQYGQALKKPMLSAGKSPNYQKIWANEGDSSMVLYSIDSVSGEVKERLTIVARNYKSEFKSYFNNIEGN